MNNKMPNKCRILVVGATSKIAEKCLEIWVSQYAAEVVLIARDEAKACCLLDDLKIRSPNLTGAFQQLNFQNPVDIDDAIAQVFSDGAVDIALVAHGTLPDQEVTKENLTATYESLIINAVSPVLFAEAIGKHMLENNHGSLGVIGSVAGDRGRKSNYIYGSAKSLIEKFVQGMQHQICLSHSLVSVTLIKPGPTATPMTAGVTGKGTLADPTVVAQDIVSGMAKHKRTIYTPRKWKVIMTVIRYLPMWVFSKLDI